MVCPYLGYRSGDESNEFEHPRAYCGATEEFVSPMHADICNNRDRFHHAEYCEVYRRVTAEEASD